MRVTPEWFQRYKAGSAIRKDAAGSSSGVRPAPFKDAGDAVRKAHKGSSSLDPPASPIYALVGLCRRASLPEPIPEFTFHPSRKWRFDYAWPDQKLALEVDGGIWIDGRHSRGSGRIKEMEKHSEAAIMGYRVLYATPQDLTNGIALDRVIRALGELKSAAWG